MSNPAAVITVSAPERDDYRRSFVRVVADGKTVAVVVTLPKTFRERHGFSHMVTSWVETFYTNPHAPHGDKYASRAEALAAAKTYAAEWAAK